MRNIESMIHRLEKKFPNKYISITQDFVYHKSFYGSERKVKKAWCLYVEDNHNLEYIDYEQMVNFINLVAGRDDLVVCNIHTEEDLR